jgi:hypothetical protein
MGIFDWFGKKDDELYVEHVPNTNMVPDYYTKDEVDAMKAEFQAANEELMRLLTLNIVKQDDSVASVRADLLAHTLEPKPEYVTQDQLDFVVETITKALREEIQDAASRNTVIVDPAPVSAPPVGWMNALQDEVVNRTEQTKAEVKAYVEDCLAAYAVEEDVELEERLANLSPISAEEIDALYMDEAETTTVAQKTVNGFRAEVYNKALSDLKLVPTSRATVAAVRAFLVKFVESLKPV